MKLLPYQVQGVQKITEFGGRCLLADEMGLGKTVQALTWAKDKRVVVICPASLKLHWQREAQQWLGRRSTILYGEKFYWEVWEELVIINYDILNFWVKTLRDFKPDVVIVDECQMICNLQTQRTQATISLCKNVEFVIGISGTPLVNQPFELYPILSIIRPDIWDSPFSFGISYCQANRDFGRWRFYGIKSQKALQGLHELLLDTCMIRRTKAEVLPELPGKFRKIRTLDVYDRDEYDHAETDFIGWLHGIDPVAARRAARDIRTRLGYLRRLASRLKMPDCLEFHDELMAGDQEKLLVGTIHKAITTGFVKRYGKKAVVIDGEKSDKQRQVAEDKFRFGKAQMLIGQIEAAGKGLNLPETTIVTLPEIPWTSGAVKQFVDRANRMTSTHSVDVWFLIAHGTIEEKLCEIVQRKSRTLDLVLDGGVSEEEELSVYDELLQHMRTRDE